MHNILTKEIMTELKYDFLENREACLRLTDDFNQLIRTPEEDFAAIKNQPWYTRIWKTFGGQNLQKVGSGLNSLAQAQSMVTELIRITAGNHLKGMQLVQLVSEDLEHVQARQGQLVGHLSRICDEISMLKRQLQYQKTMVVDEQELPEEIRILIIRAMICMAQIDGRIDENELELIKSKLDSMDLSDKARRIIAEELKAPTPLKIDMKMLDSHKVRALLYRNIAAVAVADGLLHSKEKLLLGKVAKGFGIHKGEAAKIVRDLLRLYSVEGLDVMVASLVDLLKKKRAEEEERLRAEQQQVEEERLRQIVEQMAESWMNLVGKFANLATEMVQGPFLQRIEAHTGCEEIGDALNCMNPDEVKMEWKDATASYCGFLCESLDRAILQVFPRLTQGPLWSQTVGRSLHATAMNELETSFSHLPHLRNLEESVRKCDKGLLAHITECGAVGFGLGILTGGIGILGGIGYGLWKDRKRAELAAEAINNYQSCLQTFAESTDTFCERFAQSILDAGANYFDDYLVPYLSTAGFASGQLEASGSALLSLAVELGQLSEEGGALPGTSVVAKGSGPLSNSTVATRSIPVGHFEVGSSQSQVCQYCGRVPAENVHYGKRLCDVCFAASEG